MNIKFQRAVDHWAGMPICGMFSLFERVRRLFSGRPATVQPRRILIVLLSEMGSLVLAQPMFADLRRRYPDASLHILMFAKNREVLDLLGVMPPENVITIRDKSLGGFAADSIRALLAMRRIGFDVVIDCELFSRVSSIFSYLSGAKLHVGFQPHTQEGLYRGSFINRPVLYNPYRHLSQQFLTMVAAIESETHPAAKAMAAELSAPPLLQFAAGELEQVESVLLRDFPVLQDRRLVLVYPGGGILPIRAWPAVNYKQLCIELLDEGYAVAVIGLKEDKPLAQEVVAHCNDPSCIDLTGYTRSVRHLLAIFHRASLLVTNDGGPGQFAALTPLQTLVFFGPETPALYSPLAPNIHCLYSGLSCSPCLTAYNHRNSPCDGDNQCLKQIGVAQVLQQARKLLQEAGRA
ncbi:ADP-heptose--LPS heptosyltransferase 2 [Sideroxyarcus emersonii]|uniref:ADP-heptose--LPS heptosyltransferase 2 n=1 Tax=Sideroxyarcus emersonii TaxID=2764705 RepID=A0AAN1X850_9PROT|nr:glycosyltransferase family 9 protein [Sideroxyarcus emersonii]BCK86464.1 ADP-heptose--LPS heptosyltransferase 2 [Sideroxyarcus emersonii]